MLIPLQKELNILNKLRIKDSSHKNEQNSHKWEKTKALNFTDPLLNKKNNNYFLKPDKSTISNIFIPKWTNEPNNTILEIKGFNLLIAYRQKWTDSLINHGDNAWINCCGLLRLFICTNKYIYGSIEKS